MADAIDKAVRAQGGGVVKPHQVKAMILAARRAYKAQSELGLVDDGVDFDAWRKATLHDVTGGDAPESFRTVTQRDYAAVMEYFGKLGGDDGSGLHSLALTPPARKTTDSLSQLAFTPPAQKATPSLSQQALTPPAQRATTPPSRQTRSADAQRRALWALNLVEGEVAEAFTPDGAGESGRGAARKYADALFWKIHRTERSLATPRQIWAVIFTLRKRANSKRTTARLDAGESGRPDAGNGRAGAQPSQRRARKGLGARGAAGVPLSPPDGSERFPAFSRGL